MFATRVIEAVDIFEEGNFDLAPVLPVPPTDQFGRQRFEDAVDCGNVVTIAVVAFRNLAQVLLVSPDAWSDP